MSYVKTNSTFFVIIFSLFGSGFFWVINIRKLRSWVLVAPKISLGIDPENLILIFPDIKNVFEVKYIANIILQKKRGKVASIILRLKTMRSIKIEGYQDMEKLGRELIHLVPPEQVRNANWFHR
ncbi:MAG: hypothetical protein EHM45_11920 [Desulfobacteraceae bacterium]|nr:MAG: hypothetical protein EHM45_11920 [Desulfobacteraceae bacterium]